MKLGRVRMVLLKLRLYILKGIWRSMNVLGDNSQYGLDRPSDVDFSASDAVAQLNQRDYFLWLRACGEFAPEVFEQEAKKYEDLFGSMKKKVTCVYCGK